MEILRKGTALQLEYRGYKYWSVILYVTVSSGAIPAEYIYIIYYLYYIFGLFFSFPEKVDCMLRCHLVQYRDTGRIYLYSLGWSSSAIYMYTAPGNQSHRKRRNSALANYIYLGTMLVTTAVTSEI